MFGSISPEPPLPAVAPPPEPLVEPLPVELLLVVPVTGIGAAPPLPVTTVEVSPALPPAFPSGVAPRSPPEHAASRAASEDKPSQRIPILFFERIPDLFSSLARKSSSMVTLRGSGADGIHRDPADARTHEAPPQGTNVSVHNTHVKLDRPHAF
ncbi:hypothetical protein [Sorangium sp. So ce1099]|uniref:hypothetical protein n=1 Tax=Sorangium sp. So ce1099 TaxID=3133331 RepID=UPI003F6192A4